MFWCEVEQYRHGAPVNEKKLNRTEGHENGCPSVLLWSIKTKEACKPHAGNMETKPKDSGEIAVVNEPATGLVHSPEHSLADDG